MHLFRFLAVALLSGASAAHPGEDHSHEIAKRRNFLAHSKRTDLSHCSAKLEARGVEARNIARRSAMVKSLSKKTKRDLDSVLNTNHNETNLGYTPTTDNYIVFSTNTSCALSPEITQGPYYVSGESVRRNIVEEQQGVDLYLDFQAIDTNTCEPVDNVYLEIWQANATGVYSGVVAAANGVGTDDLDNIDTTFLRGIQLTDSDGVAEFVSIFPGHYITRTTHIHVMVHHNATATLSLIYFSDRIYC